MSCAWADDFRGFLLDGLFYFDGKTKRLFPGLFDLETSGSLEDWSAAANMLFAAGCEAQSFMLLSSFAAPLMAFFDTEEGGAIVSIHGGRKAGKTVAITAAATVWGLPEALDIGEVGHAERFNVLAKLRHLPVIHNGLSKGDPYAANAFMLTALRQINRKDTRWQTVILHAGGCPLSGEAIGENEETYLFGTEFPVHVPKPLIAPRDGDHIEERLLDNRGTAGDRYLKFLVQEHIVQWARNKVGMAMADLRERTGAGNEYRFAMRAIAAVQVAGDIVKDLGILDMYPARIVEWAIQQTFGGKK